MQITLTQLQQRARLAAMATDTAEIALRMELGQEIVALAPGQITTPRIARLAHVPHTYVKLPSRWF